MEKDNQKMLIPGAIVLAAVIIGGAVLLRGQPAGSPSTNKAEQAQIVGSQNASQLESIRPIDNQDHILGNPSAPVKIVEFSDTECPFCKRFHMTMQQIMQEYGRDGKVMWVYRHFPLEQLHSRAPHEAEATECAAELGGNDGFWRYMDRLFVVTPSNNGLDPEELLRIAEFVGISRENFKDCLQSGKFKNRVARDYQDAVASGGQGTPYTIVIASDGTKYPIVGALPYEQIKSVIDTALNKPAR